jgi:hypothetical protein
MCYNKNVVLSDKLKGDESMVDEYGTLDAEEEERLRPGIDLLLTRQVAAREQVDPRTVERWIDKGLPAYKATRKQIGILVQEGYLTRLPPHGVILFIKETDLKLIPRIRAYPPDTKRPKRGKTTGAGTPERQ